jgi:hypothetical protein
MVACVPSQNGRFDDDLHMQNKTVRDSSHTILSGANLGSSFSRVVLTCLCDPSQKGLKIIFFVK